MTLAGLGRSLFWGLAAYAAICLFLFLVQRKMMYFPAQSGEAEALSRADAQGLRPWRTGDGRLIGWRPPASQGVPTRLLVFHGNAGSALDRDYFLPALAGPGREVVLFEYPGYGPRAGSPSQATLVKAAAEALAQLRRENDRRVWLVGESLGSGVAAQLAAQDPGALAGLLLVTPIARVSEVAARHYPFLPVRWLLRDRWENVTALRTYRGPVGILIAGQDEVVGADQGRRLAKAMAVRPRVWEQPMAGHNSLDFRPTYAPWPEIAAWLDHLN